MRFMTELGPTEALLVRDVLCHPAGDWSRLPHWVRHLQEDGILTFHPAGVSLRDALGETQQAGLDDWLLLTWDHSPDVCSAAEFDKRFHDRTDVETPRYRHSSEPIDPEELPF